MARDTDALNLEKWARSGTALIQTPESLGLSDSQGFPDDYGEDLSRPLELWNYQLRELTAALLDIARHGLLPWVNSQRYEHPAFVTGSNGDIYQSKQSSGGSGTSQDPVDDDSETYWERLTLDIPESNTVRRGTIETATVTEARAGTDDERAVNPLGAARYIQDAITAVNNTSRPLWL